MGILEHILQLVQQQSAQLAQIQAHLTQNQAPATTPQAYAGVAGSLTNGAIAPPSQPVVTDSFGFATQQQQQQQPAAPQYRTDVTSEMFLQLIGDAVSNPAIKDALGAEMRSMGIQSLPEAQPHQYGELYHRFETVINRFRTQQPATAPASII